MLLVCSAMLIDFRPHSSGGWETASSSQRRVDAEGFHLEWTYLQAGQEKKAAVLFTRFVLNISNWRWDL